MAVAFVRAHTGVSIKTAGTTNIGVNISTATGAGNVLVACILFDNFTTASTPTVTSIAKAAGETASWVFLGAARSTSTSAGAFASGEMWAIYTTVSWPVAAYTVTLSNSVTQKATLTQEFSGALATLRSTSGTAYSTTTTAASATTTGTTPVTGDLAVGFIFGSNVAAAQAGDTDTTGGSWSTPSGLGSTGSSGATNNFGIAQYKILTGANHQTLNNSAAMTAGNGSIVAILQQYVDPTITQAAYRFYADGTETGSTALANQDAAYTADISGGDVALGVRVRLQITSNAGSPLDDYRLQYEKNVSGTWIDVGGGAMLAAASYDVAAGAVSAPLDTYKEVGQSFSGDSKYLTRVDFSLSRVGAPSGNITIDLYAASGTPGGDNNAPTGSILASTTTVLVASTIAATSQWYAFQFNPYLLGSGLYTVVIRPTTTLDASNSVLPDVENIATRPAGNLVEKSTGSWVTNVDYDALVRVYTIAGGDVSPKDSSNLTDAAVTTARLTAGTGSFVAGKVSEDGLVDDLAITASNYTELLYSVALKQSSLVNGDTLKLRVIRNGVTTGLTYSQYPSITIVSGTAPAAKVRNIRMGNAALQRSFNR